MRITVKNEVGRPVNPHQHPANYTGLESGLSMNEFVYNEFEQSIKEHDAPKIPDTKEGEFVEAELVWQCTYNWDLSKWYDVSNEWYEDMENATANKYRQIYRIPQQPKEQLDLKQFEKISGDEMKAKDYTKEQLKLVDKVADDVFAYGKITFMICKDDWYGFIKNAFEIAFDRLPVDHNDLTSIILARAKINKIITEFETSDLLI